MQHALRGGLVRGSAAEPALPIRSCRLASCWPDSSVRRWSRQAVLERRHWLGLILTAIFWLQSDGLTLHHHRKSAFITGLYVMFTPLIATWWGQNVRRQHATGAAIATVGLYALVHVPGPAWGGWNRGDLETLLCSVLCGVQIVLTTRYNRDRIRGSC